MFKLQGHNNCMEFITDFPSIVHHFHVTELIYANTSRSQGGRDDSEALQAVRDEANRLALELLKSYVMNTVNMRMYKREGEIMARQ